MNKQRHTDYHVGDEIAFAAPAAMVYGTIIRVLGAGDSAAVEIEFEDGRKEIKKSKDRALSLLKRASGLSEQEEAQTGREQLRDPEIERIRRGEQRRR
jgi:hypothetical protein